MKEILQEMVEYFCETPVGELRNGRLIHVDVDPSDREEVMFLVTMDEYDRYVILGGQLDGTGLSFFEQGPVLGKGRQVEDFLERLTRNIRFSELIRGHGTDMRVSELENVEFFTSVSELNTWIDEHIQENLEKFPEDEFPEDVREKEKSGNVDIIDRVSGIFT